MAKPNVIFQSIYDYYSNYCLMKVDGLSCRNVQPSENCIMNISTDAMLGLKYSCSKTQKLTEAYNIYNGPMLWIGIYIAIASAICILAMAVDLFHGFRNRKFWFPCKYFSLNAASITVISVAMKLPVDLSSPMPGFVDQATKLGSMAFMCIMMANIMPSLASMDNKTLLANIIGLSILVITIIVNICIEITTGVIDNSVDNFFDKLYIGLGYDLGLRNSVTWAIFYMVLMLMLLMILVSSAITVISSKQILELKYQAIRKTTSNDLHMMSTIERLSQYVKRYWVMAESGSPQFVMACNPLSNACGIICVITLVTYTFRVIVIYVSHTYMDYQSTYKWSMLAIFVTQFIGVVVGSIAPIFRCFTVLRFKLFTRNHLVVFKVEKHWTQMLCELKENHLPFLSSARKSRVVFQNLKNLILSLCIGFQKAVVVACKIIGLIQIVFIIFVVCCSYCWQSLKALLFIPPMASSNDDIQDLSNYVLQIQDEMEFAETTVKDISNSMNGLIQKVKMEQNNDLLELLGKSTDFKGVEMFDNDQVQHLVSIEPVNGWSLPVVTLACIAVALPNIRKDKVESFLKGVGDGLWYTHLVEETLNCASEYVNVRRATMNLWHEVEDNFKWLGNPLEGNAFKEKTSQEILQWFVDKSKEIVLEIKNSSNGEPVENFPHKLIAANSMYRISGTLLLNCNSNFERISKKQLFVSLSGMVSSILSACLTNIPRAIEAKCHESVIEKREAGVRAAAKLLGRSTEIIRELEARERPLGMDQDKMAFIDEWRLHMKQSIP
ncbi:hypothetical protein OSB04_022569 [Centaurea solstitialis]|uniref:Uncharacterized protein n=1 Tax=Centaurea solstitialis TaxID=347529 RepID=A0AA38WIU8_9ASTR|nr:hypothetical protein OSB04_022569 [Centaurea solstitialis]